MEMHKLQANSLGFSGLLAQSIALISPTMTAALIIPVMFSNTGNMSWFAYGLGTLMLLFVAMNLNQFARRSTGSGSIYTYVCKGLGLTAGGIAGWSLIWAYLGISIAGLTGFAIFGGKLLDMVGLHLHPVVLFAVSIAICWYCAWRNVHMSAMLMLMVEASSMALIGLLCFFVLKDHGFATDAAQFDFSQTPVSKLGLGVVVAIFSLVGFESATSFGEEAKNPLRSIPRAVIWSLLISGLFFVFVTYVMVLGVRGYSAPLDKIDAPLNVLAELVHLKALQIPISISALFSFFSLSLSCVNAGARIILAMGRHAIFPTVLADTHHVNRTPYLAIALMCGVAFAIPSVLALLNIAPLDIFNYAGTMAAFGFLVPYFLITIAAPVYLTHVGALKARHLAVCLIALLLLLIPALGSVYPMPDAPVNFFPYVFLLYLIVGVVWIVRFYRRMPTASLRVRQDIDKNHAMYAERTATHPGSTPADDVSIAVLS